VGDADWIRSSVAEVLRLAPDVILANASAMARAAHRATRTVPIVFIGPPDPVEGGLVESLAHPGGNATIWRLRPAVQPSFPIACWNAFGIGLGIVHQHANAPHPVRLLCLDGGRHGASTERELRSRGGR
jgi:hypothetical protein